MGGGCKGKCKNHKVPRRLSDAGKFKSSHYPAGHKYCSACEIFVDTDNMSCSCCGRKYRISCRHRAKSVDIQSRYEALPRI